jgi:metal-sulfur cluster biosynthetic enzyme
MPITEDQVREQLKLVIDPELFVNIVDLGLIYVVDIQNGDEGKENVHVEMTMTSPMCPAGPQLVANSRQVIESIEGVGNVEIKVVMDPPWTQDRMTEDARDQLGIF